MCFSIVKQEDEIRKKMEEIAIERQKRIAERTAAAAGSGSTNKTKTGATKSSQPKKTNSKVAGM